MFFSLCSSAGVHGVFVRLFFGGGSMGAEAMLGSPAPAEDEAIEGDTIEGDAIEDDAIPGPRPDIVNVAVPGPGAGRLFRAPVGDKLSGFTELSAGLGKAK
jgi:hypothetical protein